jgi:hypothetical protein
MPLPSFHYSSIRDRLDTFDLVFFSGRGLKSRIIQIATGSMWGHVAMVIRAGDVLLCWEATTLANLADIASGHLIEGSQTVGLGDRIRTYDGRVAVRHWSGVRTPEMRRDIEALRQEFSGRRYEGSLWQLAGAVMPWSNKRDTRELFCSEQAVEGLRKVGIMYSGKHLPPSNEYHPAELFEDMGCREGKYSQPYEVAA